MKKRTKRSYATGTLAIAGLLLFASAALACTTFVGIMKVSASGTTKTNTGNTTGMGFCNGKSQNAKIKLASSFTINLEPNTGAGVDCWGYMGGGTATVKHVNSAFVPNCMNGASIGEFTLDANGYGGKGSPRFEP